MAGLEWLNYALMGGRMAGSDAAAITRRALIAAEAGVGSEVLGWAVELHGLLIRQVMAGRTLWQAVMMLRSNPHARNLFDLLEAVQQRRAEAE